jgi:transcription initiation factor IIE alpha subunit
MDKAAIERLVAKTADHLFLYELIADFELSPREAQAILETAKVHLQPGPGAGVVRPGQIKVVVTSVEAQHGRPLLDTDRCEVVVTVDAGADDLAIRQSRGPIALRRARIQRLVDEALDQGGLLTEEDLARLLHVHARTIRRDVKVLRQAGKVVPTRGHHQDIGRGQSHKEPIVEKHLQGHGYHEIARQTGHSLDAVQRYLQTFGRVVYLCHQGLEPHEIAFLVGHSLAVVEQHLALYDRFRQVPAYQSRLAELTRPPTGRPYLPLRKGGTRP